MGVDVLVEVEVPVELKVGVTVEVGVGVSGATIADPWIWLSRFPTGPPSTKSHLKW